MLRELGHEPVALMCTRGSRRPLREGSVICSGGAPADLDVVFLPRAASASRRCCARSSRISRCAPASRGRSRRKPSRCTRTGSSTGTRRFCRATAGRIQWRGQFATARTRSGSPSTNGRRARHRQRARNGSRSRSTTSRAWEDLEAEVRSRSRRALPVRLAQVERGRSRHSAARGKARVLLLFFEPDYAWIDWKRPAARDRVVRSARGASTRRRGRRTGALTELDSETVRVLRVSLEPADGREMRCGDGKFGSWRRNRHETGHRDHDVCAGRDAGASGTCPLRSSRSLRRCRRARRRTRRCSSRRARTESSRRSTCSTGSCSPAERTSILRTTARTRIPRPIRHRRGATRASWRYSGRARAGPADARDLPRVPAPERRPRRRPRPAPARGGRARRTTSRSRASSTCTPVEVREGSRLAGSSAGIGRHVAPPSGHRSRGGGTRRDARGPQTARSRPSRIRRSASPSACSGIPRRARTRRCSRRSSRRRARTAANPRGAGSRHRRDRRNACTSDLGIIYIVLSIAFIADVSGSRRRRCPAAGKALWILRCSSFRSSRGWSTGSGACGRAAAGLTLTCQPAVGADRRLEQEG